MAILADLYRGFFGRLWGKGFGLGLFNKFHELVWDRWLRPEFVEVQGVRYFPLRGDRSISDTLGKLEVPEPELTAEFLRRVGPGMTVLDLGANIGYYTLLAAKAVGPSGRVLAFEPEMENAAALMKGLEANGFRNVTVFPYAVSRALGQSDLFMATTSGSHSIALRPSNASSLRQRVVTVALDGFLDPDVCPDVVKMDIEGSEVPALEGMRRLLADPRLKTLFIEAEPPILASLGLSAASITSLLEPYGFRCAYVDTAKKNLVCVRP